MRNAHHTWAKPKERLVANTSNANQLPQSKIAISSGVLTVNLVSKK